MAQMNTDAAVLAKEAANFERISGELKGVIAHVESTAGALAGQWHGQAGTAAQAALMRFHEAAARQIQELNDISANIHTSGVQYTVDRRGPVLDARRLDEPLTDYHLNRNGENDMTEQLWNFAGIEGGASDIQGSVATTAGLLDEGKGSLAALAAVWGGTGSEAYQAVQMRWDSTSAELNSALQNLAATISESSATMAQTEAGVTGMFA